jgi:hypothetical protein
MKTFFVCVPTLLPMWLFSFACLVGLLVTGVQLNDEPSETYFDLEAISEYNRNYRHLLNGDFEFKFKVIMLDNDEASIDDERNPRLTATFHSSDFYNPFQLVEIAKAECGLNVDFSKHYESKEVPCQYEVATSALARFVSQYDHLFTDADRITIHSTAATVNKLIEDGASSFAARKRASVNLESTIQGIDNIENVVRQLNTDMHRVSAQSGQPRKHIEFSSPSASSIAPSRAGGVAFCFLVNRDLSKEHIWKQWFSRLTISHDIFVHASVPAMVKSPWFRQYLLPATRMRPTR